MRFFWEALTVLAVVVLIPALFLSANNLLRSSSRSTPADFAAPTLSDKPYEIKPLVKPIFAVGSPEYQAIQKIIQNPPAVPLDGPVAIHLLRAYGLGAINRKDITSGAQALRLLTGHSIPGHPLEQSPIVQTRWGARYRDIKSNPFGENHRDVFLATFAEMGVPLSTSLHISDSMKLTVADLLRDSIANFHLGQIEIEWTSIAYAMYMPDVKNWRNRDGEVFGFDQLASALLNRSGADDSCAGSHVLIALTYLLRIDGDFDCLAKETRGRVNNRLADAASTLALAQHSDGSWTTNWQDRARVADPKKDAHGQLLATGHLLEWGVYLPQRFQPAQPIQMRAARWLQGATRRMSGTETRADICGWTHALCALMILSPDVSNAENTARTPFEDETDRFARFSSGPLSRDSGLPKAQFRK